MRTCVCFQVPWLCCLPEAAIVADEGVVQSICSFHTNFASIAMQLLASFCRDEGEESRLIKGSGSCLLTLNLLGVIACFPVFPRALYLFCYIYIFLCFQAPKLLPLQTQISFAPSWWLRIVPSAPHLLPPAQFS